MASSLKSYTKRNGTALIVSMIFIVIFSSLAVCMSAVSGTNVQVARNQQNIDRARASAESGMDVIRYWLSEVSISGTTEPSQVLSTIASSLQNELSNDGITNIAASYDSSTSTITIPSVTLDTDSQSSFSAVITAIDSNTYQVDVTGIYGDIQKTIRVNYLLDVKANTVFDFGVATKGPLSLSGNVELEGVNVSVEASVYIESPNTNLALSIIGNSQIAGDVSIVNDLAYVDLQGGQAGIGGETGQAAIDNHVDFGVPPSDFPEPVTDIFESYISSIIDANTDTSADGTFENIRILPNTNPNFTGNVTLKGIVFVDTPNIVTFTGNADVTAIIVGDGSQNDNSGTNQINFLGSVDSHPIEELPAEEKFAGLDEETGTFVIAPGFKVSFGGSFDMLCGAIAGNGIEFFGNAGGIINGSVLNYSDELMDLSGNSDLYFNRSGTSEAPAGFVPQLFLGYNSGSYSEVI